MFSLGTAPFSPTSSWNTAIGTGATYTRLNWPGSTGFNYGVNWDTYAPAVYVASASDPLVQVSYPPGWGYPGGTIGVHMPAGVTGAAGTDGEILVVDGDFVYNFWQFNRTSATTGTASAFGETNIVSGTGWGSKSPFLSAGVTASGASELAGLLVKAETDQGQINHALQLVVDSELAKSGFTGDAISGDGGSTTGIVQEGAHLGIPPGTPMPAGLSALGQEVFRAMQQYGAFVVDVAGGTTQLRAQANAYDDATISALQHDMGSITPLLQQVSGGTSPPVTQPTLLSSIAASGTGITNGDGNLHSGTVHLTLAFSKPVNVSGAPTLTLNDNATASYVSGSGSNNLVFDYAIGAGQTTSDLAVTAFNLSGVKDLAGNSVNLTGAPSNPAGTLAIDTTSAKLLSIAASGTGITNGDGNLNSGTVHLTLTSSEAVNVTGTPTLTLNDNATASYVSGSGSNKLVFDYAIGAGQTTSDLAVTAFNLSGVKDLAGNSLDLTGAPTNPPGTLAIGTTPPPAPDPTLLSSIAASGTGITNGDGNLNSGTVHLALAFSNPVNVSGTPTLTLNDNATASYVSGSGSNNLVFDYAIGAGQTTSDLAVTAFNLSGVKDLAGNSVNLTGAPSNPAGTLAIDTTSAKLLSIAASGTGITNGDGNLNSGTVHLTLTSSEAVNVTGTPTLTLNDNATASYVSGSGSNNLVFDYAIGAGQTTSDLAVTAFNLSGVKDLAGNSLDLTGAPTNPPGTLAIGTTPPPAPDPTLLSSIAASGTGITNGDGNLNSGTVHLALAFSNPVNVSGTPTLTLNDNATASYVSGSGSNNLVFDYAIGAGQTTSDLAVTAFNLSGVKDLAGNSLDLTGAPTNPPGTLAIGTTPPPAPDPTLLSSIAASGTGITNGDGNLNSGTVHLALAFSNPVNVSGTPTLTLNDNATASYVSGSGSNNLVFDYAIGAGQTTSDLAVTAFNLSGVKDLAGNSLDLTGAPTNPPGTLAIGTTPQPAPGTPSTGPTVVDVTTKPLSRNSGTISVLMSDNVTVNGTPSLLLDNGGTAVYKSGSGSSALTFAYSNSFWNRTGSTPHVTGIVFPSSSSITDLAGNAADLSEAGTATTSSGGRFSITGTTELELFGPSAKRVSFAPGASGELQLDTSSQFSGRISGFGRGDTLDLGDIAFGSNTTLAYQANSTNSGGTLSVGDGEHVAKLALLGQYAASSFVMSAGATGGTAIHEALSSSPSPTLTSSSQTDPSMGRHCR